MIEKCMMCGKEFETDDATNAICSECAENIRKENRGQNRMQTLLSGAFDEKRPGSEPAKKEEKPAEPSRNDTPEACWESLLHSAGAEYVQDTVNDRFIPVFYRISDRPVTNEPDLKTALSLLKDPETRKAYTAEAERLEKIRLELKEAVAAKKTADVFVCDAAGQNDPLGAQIREILEKQGIRVFRSGPCAAGKQPGEYENAVFADLTKDRTMVIAVSNAADFYTWHMYSEWKRFLRYSQEEGNRSLIICTNGVQPADIPEELDGIPLVSTQRLDFEKKLTEQVLGNDTAPKPMYIADAENEKAADLHLTNSQASGNAYEHADAEQEMQEKSEADRNGKKKKASAARTAVSAVAAVLCVSAAVASAYVLRPGTNPYSLADEARSSGNYEVAVRILSGIDSEDARSRIDDIRFLQADECCARGDFEGAASVLSMVGTEEAGEKLDEVRFQQAEAYLGKGDYDGACALLEQLGTEKALSRLNGIRSNRAEEAFAAGDYETACSILSGLGTSEADERLAQIRFIQAENAFAAGDYDFASEIFRKLGTQEAENRVYDIQMLRAEEAFQSGDYDAACSVLETLNSDESAEKILLIRYAEADGMMQQKRYAEAAQAFDLLVPYSDSEKKAAQCRADQLFENGAAEEAYAIFASLDPEYRDQESWYQEQYANAAGLLGAGDWENAAAAFEQIPYLDDSAQLALQARYQQAVQVVNGGDAARAMELFTALNGYQDSSEKVENIERYQAACALMEEGRFREARELFAGLSDRFDADARIDSCYSADYAAAQALLEGGDVAGAYQAFEQIQEYGDSADRCADIDKRYEQAGTSALEGNLSNAISLYEGLGNYLDSSEKWVETTVARAVKATAEGDFDAARADLDRVRDKADIYQEELQLNTAIADQAFNEGRYEVALEHYLALEQTDMLKEREYNLAQFCADARYFDVAVKAYESLNGYRDSATLLTDTHYRQAVSVFDEGKPEEALALFEALNGYADSDWKAAECRYRIACAALEEKRYDEAAEAFDMLNGYADSAAKATECRYRMACSLFDEGRYDEAAESFEKLNGYADSADRVLSCRYMSAVQMKEQGDAAAAAEAFAALQDYRDSAEQILSCRYMLASAAMENGDYDAAEEMFASLGDYLDSRAQLPELKLRRGMLACDEGDFALAEARFDEAGENEGLTDALLYAAEKAEEMGDMTQALRFCRRAGTDAAAERIASLAKTAEENGNLSAAAVAGYMLKDRDGEQLQHIQQLSRDISLDEVSDLLYDLDGDELETEGLFACIEEGRNQLDYADACALLDAGDIEGARDIFAALPDDLADTAEKLAECDLYEAEVLRESGDYEGAYRILIQYTGREEVDRLLQEDEQLAVIVEENSRNGQFKRIGNRVTFGSYDQNGNPSDGAEPIEWVVVDFRNGKSLLLSVNALDSVKYRNDSQNVTWENSDLRSWLNSTFVDAAFTEEEKGAIMFTRNEADSATHFSNAGNDTEDRVFVLSAAEAEKLKDKDLLTAVATESAIRNGAANVDGYAWYWLRSSGSDNRHAATISTKGFINANGNKANSQGGAVRPAVWVDAELIPE